MARIIVSNADGTQAPAGDDRITVLTYGSPRSGKTRFAASFPRPAFLSDASEGGWTTMEHLDDSFFYEPDRPPEVFKINLAQDVMITLQRLAPRIASGEICTVVFDSLTFYSDAFLNHLYKMAPVGKPINKFEIYGGLGKHLNDLRIQVHQLQCNIVWICLARHPEADSPTGKPLLTGQSAEKFPAGCDLISYQRVFEEKDEQGPYSQYEIRTAPWGNYMAGGRFEGKLPDPLPEAHYRCLAEHLNLADPFERFKNPKAQQRKPVGAAAPTSTASAPSRR
jgi:hypothetical protein